ncbi:hypothetical protein EO93_02530 [Methanosarcina sp. 1.H.A.2.2]|nr:hypothetical protein EO93_02530 [Methanosarcina sp. 1.H.A.2.2]
MIKLKRGYSNHSEAVRDSTGMYISDYRWIISPDKVFLFYFFVAKSLKNTQKPQGQGFLNNL